MPNISAQIFSLNIALFLFNFFILQYIVKKLLEMNRLKKELSHRPEQVLLDADIKAEKIIETAVKKASEIISSAEHSTIEIKNKINGKLEQLVTIQGAKIEDELAELQAESTLLLKNISERFAQSMTNATQEISAKGESSINDMFAKFKDQTEGEYSKIHKQLMQEYDKSIAEVNSYKENRQKEIDMEVLKIVKKITKQVLPKIFSEKFHEELILESIKKAKRDHVLY